MPRPLSESRAPQPWSPPTAPDTAPPPGPRRLQARANNTPTDLPAHSTRDTKTPHRRSAPQRVPESAPLALQTTHANISKKETPPQSDSTRLAIAAGRLQKATATAKPQSLDSPVHPLKDSDSTRQSAQPHCDPSAKRRSETPAPSPLPPPPPRAAA